VTLYPVLPDIDRFERDVDLLLRGRSRNGISTNNTIGAAEPFGFTTTFVGVLFAVLASGCQVSDLPKKERVFLCQVFGQSSITIALFSLLMLFSFLRLPMSAKRKLPISSIGGSDSSPLDYRRCLIVQHESGHRLRDVWLVIALIF
jgi:hypothetical protein